MAFSKVTLNGDTLMDVTQKTVTAASMLSRTTALKNDGTDITGNIATKTSANLSASGATVTAPAGYYASDASKSVATGTAGTPTATKGTVSNHAVSVTPSVTNTEGYISGGTKTGTAVSVAASELVSGTKSITENGSGIDISEYAAVDVDVDKNLWRITNVGTDTETGATGASNKCVIEDAIPTSLSYLKLFGVAASSISDISGTDGYVRVVSAGKNLLPYDNGTVHLNSGGNDCYIIPQADGGLRITGSIVAGGIGGYIFYGNYSKLNVPQGSYKIRLTGSGTGFDNVLLQIYSDTGSGFSSSWYGTSYDFTVGSAVLKNYIRLRIAGGTSGTTFDCTVYPILMFGTEENTTFSPPATTYAVPIDSPGLMGIPVTSGGNVTDTSSNRYVADVIDISAGTLTRNCGYIASYAGETLPGEWIASSTSGSSPATGAKVVYELSDPTTTSLTDAQLAVLRSIKPQEGDGTIYTTGLARALMSMGYYQNLISETTQSAQTIHPSTTDQTIASGTYLTGTQTIKAVTTINLTAANIVSGVTVKIGDSTDDDCVASVTGTASSGYSETLMKNYIERASSFTDIDWPSGMTKIGSHAFAGCTSFNPSSLPSEITSIAAYAFYDCTNLPLTSLPSGITSIGAYAFSSCTNLALTSLPSGVTRIYDYTFNNCTKLALTSLPSGVTAVGDHAFSQCTSLALTSLPSGVTSISNYAFAYCTGITSISCSGTITTLVSYSFTGSSSYPMALTSVSFPNMTVSSLSYAFGSTTAANACQLLAFADIGSTKAIASSSFANCYALQTLVLRRTDAICSLGNVSAFLNTPLRGYNSLTAEVYVPNALISTYQTATNWSTLYNNGTITFKKIEGSDYDLS